MWSVLPTANRDPIDEHRASSGERDDDGSDKKRPGQPSKTPETIDRYRGLTHRDSKAESELRILESVVGTHVIGISARAHNGRGVTSRWALRGAGWVGSEP
jgi:hypothetical protein